MSKRELKPTVALRPVPVVLVTCGDRLVRPNVITLAWVGVVCSTPPMLSIAVRPERFSHHLIEESKEFVINIPGEELVWATDYCGVRSGRDEDKFACAGLTPTAASKVSAPLIAECPINIECVLRHKLSLGSHDLFIGEVVALHAEETSLENSTVISTDRARPILYAAPDYLSTGRRIETHGFSRQKPRPPR